jgi:hypothetical protein
MDIYEAIRHLEKFLDTCNANKEDYEALHILIEEVGLDE